MFLQILNQHAYSQTFKKSSHEEVLPRKPIFQKTYRPLLKKLQKQKNYCSRLDKKERKNFFNKLNTSFVSDNKLFWKNVKFFYSHNGSHRVNIKLVEGNKLLQDDSEVAEERNNLKKLFQL